MLDKNAKVEQFIYTAGGKRGANGSFDFWSMSPGLSKPELTSGFEGSMFSLSQRMLNENVRVSTSPDVFYYDQRDSSSRVLKAGAVPHGLFKKYRDEDYETVVEVVRPKITVLQESTKNGLRKEAYGKDFRAEPDNAPRRIAWCKTLDGRLMVVSTTAIGGVFSEVDARGGNYVTHAFIFSKGTEIEDVDVSKLPFVTVIDKKYWSEQLTPDALPSLTVEELYQQRQSAEKPTEKSEPQMFLPTERVLTLVRNCLFAGQEASRTILTREASRGNINVPEVLLALERDAKGANEEERTKIEKIKKELSMLKTPYKDLLKQLERYVEDTARADEAFENGRKEDAGQFEQLAQIARNVVKLSIEKLDVEKVCAVAQSQQRYVEERYARVKQKTPLVETRDFKVADLLKKASESMLRGKSFDEQNYIT